MNAGSHPKLPDFDPPPSPPPPSVRSSLSSPPPSLDPAAEGSSLPPLDPEAEGGSLPPLDPGAEGGSLPPGRGILPRFVANPLSVLVARDPLPDPRSRSRLPHVAALPPAALPGSDEVSSGVAGVVTGCVRNTPERPGGVTSVSLAVSRFAVTTKLAFP